MFSFRPQASDVGVDYLSSHYASRFNSQSKLSWTKLPSSLQVQPRAGYEMKPLLYKFHLIKQYIALDNELAYWYEQTGTYGILPEQVIF
jgi:hypothetical protein